jgi:asparagine synthase (glutamine-hydrolysing)
MESLLPPEIAWRRDKKGFSNPQGEWLKHELQEPVREAFSAKSLIAQREIVDSKALLRKYDRYRRQPPQSGAIWYREIFAPLSLEIWMRQYEAWIA